LRAHALRGHEERYPDVTTDLIIIGASARAAALSARRAGMRPWCADLFADRDLRRLAPVRRVADYPHGLLAALADAPQAPLLYTGGLENWPDLLAQVGRPLWGNGPDILRRVRSPFLLARCFGERGLRCPAVRAAPPARGRWLLKPRRGAGGFGIRPFAGQRFNPRTHYLQEWLDGTACSAVYVGLDDGARLLRVTRQLVGTPWLHATGFHYAGSIGPLPGIDRAAWQALGDALVEDFRLRGVFGVDAVVRDGVPWPVEVNPRYPASVEVLERALGVPALALHRAAFTGGPASAPAPTVVTTVWGKAILCARRNLIFPAEGPWEEVLRAPQGDNSPFADIPAAGEMIESSRPVLTLCAAGTDVADCEARLRKASEALDRYLWP